MNWHNLTVAEALKELGASRSGLAEEEARKAVADCRRARTIAFSMLVAFQWLNASSIY